MKAFVTGATGLLGTNLVRLLCSHGHVVRALVRTREKAASAFAGLELEVVQGDIENISGFASALDDCDVLFHTAAYFREYYQPGEHWPILERINIRGTMQLLGEAARRGIKTVVDTSSSGVVGAEPNGQPGDESSPPAPETTTNLYFKSKLLCQREVMLFAKQHAEMRTMMVLPGWMFGPYDAGPTGSGKLVLDFLAQRLPGAMDGGTCMVDARDVAQAMIAMAERGQNGARYIVAGPYHSLAELLWTLEAASGVLAPKRHIPWPFILTYARLAEWRARFTGRAPTVSLQGIRLMHAKRQVRSEKAVRELGVTFRPLLETLRDEVEWYRQRPVGQ